MFRYLDNPEGWAEVKYPLRGNGAKSTNIFFFRSTAIIHVFYVAKFGFTQQVNNIITITAQAQDRVRC